MKKKNIIKKSYEITKIINFRQSKKNNYYSIYYLNNQRKYNCYGITIPKKIGIAVVRNKLKRQIKNIIDNNQLSIQTPYDYVIIVRNNILNLDYKEKEKELISLLKEIGEKNEKKN